MDDLAQFLQFLRDRIAEDEQTARAATWDEWDSAHWTARPPQAAYERYTVADHLDDGVVVVTPENADADGVGQHIARHDPARALREVEAKRRLVDEFAATGSVPDTPERRASPHWKGDFGYLQGLARAVHLLALPYSDHPDYLDAWRP
ncbi:DUF6221 family protein [Streptomyces sp. DH8]|uniref:DUF6221 family protein n=1 Tax=Streptomyces sp. DH8 TaxID=2857008 RepID=UPI001E561039|nr:DUF6221 family protein [Streptomyces sp. DH8]